MSPDETLEQETGDGEDRRTRRTVSAIAAALLLLLFVCLLWWLLSQRARVPEVVGMERDDARAAIAQAGFAVGSITSQTALPGEEGKVLDQEPSGGRFALKGSDVDIAVGVRPGVSGSETTEESEGIDGSEAASFTAPQGTGAEAPPQQYTAPADTRRRVPNVLGMTQAAARAALAAKGYRSAVRVGPVSTTAAAGTVYFQEPAPDSYEPAGTVVTIWVANDASPSGYVLPTD